MTHMCVSKVIIIDSDNVWSTAEGPRARPLAGYLRTAMTFDIQMSTNVVMPHPNDALLRHDDYLILTSYEYCAGTWRHRQVGGPPEKSNGGKND